MGLGLVPRLNTQKKQTQDPRAKAFTAAAHKDRLWP